MNFLVYQKTGGFLSMVEKKFVVYDLRISYNGPVKIADVYKEVEEWIKQKGLNKELKKKAENLTPKGKKLEWTIECWKNINTFTKGVVRLRSFFTDVKEIEVKRKGRRIKTQQANVLLQIDGILETDLSQRWEQTPLFYFIRALLDKYVWPFYSGRYDGIVSGDANDLLKTLQSFFNLQKITVQ